MENKTNFAFFGTDNFSVGVLDELKKVGFLPILIITSPDKPKGRGLKITPPPVKLWAIENKIDFLQPEKLDEKFNLEIGNCPPASPSESRRAAEMEIGVVASYGKILPAKILASFPKGILNVPPSLLPKYRGASPIQAQILNDEKKVGITIILMDEKMDNGPILASLEFPNEILDSIKLSEKLATEGGKLLAETIQKWLAGEIKPIPQNHSQATFCQKIAKEDGLIDLNNDSRQNFLKIQAFAGWPGAYFFVEQNRKKIRMKITKASFSDGKLKIESVIPEGKKEVYYNSK